MTFFDLARTQFDGDFADKLQSLSRDPRFAQYITITDPEGATTDAEQGAQDTYAFIRGKLAASALPRAFRMLSGGIITKLGLQNLFNPTGIPARPKEDGLPEALKALAAGKEQLPAKLVNVDFDLSEVKFLSVMIPTVRMLVKGASRFTNNLLNNLSVMEDRGYRVLKTAYDLVRPVVQKDEDLFDVLEDAETYLYGSAKTGAETAKVNRKRAQTMQDQVEKKGQAAADKAARNLVADEVAGLLDTVRHFTGQPESPATTAPAASASVPAAAPADQTGGTGHANRHHKR